MTAPQYIRNLLEQEWESSITGRPHDVGELDTDDQNGQIKVVFESNIEWRRMDLANYDYITIQDGGISEMTPTSFGWLNEDNTSRVDLDIRSRGWPDQNRPGRLALYGERGARTLEPNEAPRWGGVAGEALRIVKSIRKGDAEYSLARTPELNDVSSEMGGQIWRGIISIHLETRSGIIDTST